MAEGLYGVKGEPMHKVTFDANVDIFEENRKLADRMAKEYERCGVRAFDVMGSIGSGKTTMIQKMAEMLHEKDVKVGAILGDVAGDDDYKRISGAGIEAISVNTGKECHLDAHYISHAFDKLDLESLDILFIENVGNLVCPADFPLGCEARMVVISVTEGDDMVRKHPLIFSQTDIAVLNKVDLAEYMGVDIQLIIDDYQTVNPGGTMYLTNARSGKGVDVLLRDLGLL